MGSLFNERLEAHLPRLLWPIRLKDGPCLPVKGPVEGKCAATACDPTKQRVDGWSLGHVTVLRSLTSLVILEIWICNTSSCSPSASFLLSFLKSLCVSFTSVTREHDGNVSLREPEKQIVCKQGAGAQTVIAVKDSCNNKSWCTFSSVCNRDRSLNEQQGGERGRVTKGDSYLQCRGESREWCSHNNRNIYFPHAGEIGPTAIKRRAHSDPMLHFSLAGWTGSFLLALHWGLLPKKRSRSSHRKPQEGNQHLDYICCGESVSARSFTHSPQMLKLTLIHTISADTDASFQIRVSQL